MFKKIQFFQFLSNILDIFQNNVLKFGFRQFFLVFFQPIFHAHSELHHYIIVYIRARNFFPHFFFLPWLLNTEHIEYIHQNILQLLIPLHLPKHFDFAVGLCGVVAFCFYGSNDFYCTEFAKF